MSNKSSPSPPPPPPSHQTNDTQSNKESKDGKSTPPPSSSKSPPPPPPSPSPPPPPPTKDSQSDKESKDDTSSPPSNSESSPPPPTSWYGSKVSSPAKTSPPQSSPPSPKKSPPPPSKSPPQSPPPPKKESSPSPSPSSPPPPNQKTPSPPPPSKTGTKEQSPPPPPPSTSEDTPQSPPQKTPPAPPLSPPPSSTTNPTPPAPSSNTLEASTSLPVASPTSANVSIKSSPGLSPDVLASKALSSPPQSSSNASEVSSPSAGSSNQTQNKTDNSENANLYVIINATVAGVVVLVAFVGLFFLMKKRREKKQPNLPDVAYYQYKFDGKESILVNSSETAKGPNYYIGPEAGIIAGSKTFFTYEELMEMTDGFARENVIGEGGFGCVYKGRIPGGKLVAVKRLKVGSGQGEREFKAEVEIISRIHHRHLVSLVGYCIAQKQRLLIYDFVTNKTLEHHLHGKEMPVLEWANRVKIAIGAAKGLAYLHEDCQPRIIHRDIKSANILLDDDFEAQVADFGLARLNDTSQTHVSTRVMGTFGYLAPEYASSGKLTDRSDVFSFGVVLLELITGRKPVDPTQPLGDESLVEWARPVLIQALESGDISKVIDPRLEKRYVESEVLTMIEAAAACVRHNAAKRPRMALVLRALDYEGWDLSNGVKVGQSITYDSAKYSEEIEEFRKMTLSCSSSVSDIYDEEFSSEEMSHGQPSWKSEYSSNEYTAVDSDIHSFRKSGSGHSDGGASGNYGGGRFR